MTHQPWVPMGAPPGWYPDPTGQPGMRWWNGMIWADQIQQAATPNAGSCRNTPPNAQAAMWAHIAPLCTLVAALILFPLVVCFWVGPLVIRSSYKNDAFVRHHATQALNETLTGLSLFLGLLLLICVAALVSAQGGNGVGIAAIILALVAAVLIFALGITRAVFEVIAAIKAYHGDRFIFPAWIAFRFVKDDAAIEFGNE